MEHLVRTSCMLLFCVVLGVGSQEDPDYWRKLARDNLDLVLDTKRNTGAAKNVIMFLGDGMGISTVTAARVLKNQLNNNTDQADEPLEFEKFENLALLKTYSVDYQTPDSASTATAYLSGIKTNHYTLGVSARTRKGNCSSQFGNEVTSILDWSLKAGKSVGIVSTSRVTHASPAALYAHAAYRNWEGDVDLINITGAEACTDIAYQLIMDNPNIQVIFGGGRRYFLPVSSIDLNASVGVAYQEKYQRRDGINLIDEWKEDKEARGLKHTYVHDTKGLNSIAKDTDYALGLFNYSHMGFDIDRDKDDVYGEPSLTAMTRKAIEILSKNEKGFFLFVEGSRIDHAHHKNLAKKALYEVLAMEEAVALANSMTRSEETLTIVTADHSHPFNLIGYPKRGHNMFDTMHGYHNRAGYDGVLNTPLLYANGPGYREARRNYTHEEANDVNFRQDSVFGRSSSTHSGEDVAVLARGPMSHLFCSVHEQNYVAHVMAYASCVGAYAEKCHVGMETQHTETVYSYSNGVTSTHHTFRYSQLTPVLFSTLYLFTHIFSGRPTGLV